MSRWLFEKKQATKKTVTIYYWQNGPFDIISAAPISFKGAITIVGTVKDDQIIFPKTLPHGKQIYPRYRYNEKNPAPEIAAECLQQGLREANAAMKRL